MAKIYTVTDGEETHLIPSMEFLDTVVKMIQDDLYLVSHNNRFEGFPSIEYNIEELPVGLKEQPVVCANEVETDSNHKFISESILSTLVDKPSKFELEQSLTQVKQELMKEIEKSYMRIVNTPDVLKKLREIAIILNEDKVADGILNSLSQKINFNNFMEHETSNGHLNNNDRKALNMLIKCLSNGFSDWNAKDGEVNAIKNKPTSLPANGGNADTIANHGIKDIINRDDYDIVIGTIKDTCTFYAENGVIDHALLERMIKSLSRPRVIFIKRGNYITDYLYCGDTTKTIIEGHDSSLVNIIINKAFLNNTVIRNLSISNSVLYINSDCKLDNVEVSNCTLIFERCNGSTITNCTFRNCNFGYKEYFSNNIVKFNRYYYCRKPIKYIGNGNIITENI